MRPPSGRRGSRAAPALAAVVLLLCVLFSGGATSARLDGLAGPHESRLAAISAVALAATALLAALALFGRLPRPALDRPGIALVAAFGALAVWVGASLVWSVQGDRSWDYANLTLVYAGLLVLGLLAGAAGPWAVRMIAGALAVVVGGAVVWGLAGKVIPALNPLEDGSGRLTGTLDYWNAFALLVSAGLPLALWLGKSRRPSVRYGAALLVYASGVALLLTFSRGGLLVAAAAVGVWLVLVPGRLASLGRLAVGGLPALAVAGLAFALPGVSSDNQPRDVRVHDGVSFGVALVLGAALVVAVALVLERRPLTLTPERRRWIVRALLIGLLVVGALAVAVAIVSASTPLTIHAGPGRFLRLGSSDRWRWWTEAVDIFRDRPLAGSGAGTFEVARRAFAEGESVAIEPHNLLLQFLAELGAVGLLLLVIVLASAGAVVTGAVRRLEGEDGLAARALAAVCVAYVLHSLVEFDWDFIALTGPVLLVVGVLAAAGGPTREGRAGLVPALAAVLVGAAAVVSVATPWAADQRLEDSQTLLTSEHFAAAAKAAKDAHELNPLSAEALLAWGFAVEQQGEKRRAADLYRRATDLQPENPGPWRARAEFELDTLHERELARRSVTRALELDPGNSLIQALAARIG
jgi:O-antigen ligase/Flp pilus assembly protein TadD